MARYVHHYTGEGGATGCCGKKVSTLGLGALLEEDPDEVTCPKMPTAPEEVDVDLDKLEESDLTEAYDAQARAVADIVNGGKVALDELQEGLKLREGDQQLPIPNGEPDIQSQVIGDIVERREVGIQRYGTALQPWNGRDPVRDLYEELLDGAMYAKQILVERAHLLNRIAELEIELATMRAGRA